MTLDELLDRIERDDPATHTFNWRQRTCEEIL